MSTPSPIEIREPPPGALGRIVELHGRYYARHWGFGPVFEAEVARELGEFRARLDPAHDGLWVALRGEAVLGAIAIDGGGEDAPDAGRQARLRWFILDDDARGQGIGRRLLATALDFCRGAGVEAVYLWTFEGLDAARRLYEEAGFALTETFTDTAWGTPVLHQRFDLHLMRG